MKVKALAVNLGTNFGHRSQPCERRDRRRRISHVHRSGNHTPSSEPAASSLASVPSAASRITYGLRLTAPPLGGRSDVPRDSAARRHDEGGDEPDDSTSHAGRNAKLEDGEPSGRCVDGKANDQPNDRPDHARRDRPDDCPAFGQRHPTQFDHEVVHTPSVADPGTPESTSDATSNGTWWAQAHR
jgi:hypothetical protein